MRLLTSVLVLGVAALAARAETPTKTVSLYDGKSLAGLTLVTDVPSKIAEVCHVTADGNLAVGGKPAGYLLAAGTYSNYRLHLEWRWPANAAKNSNGGILLHISSGPIAQNRWPRCIQVQMKLNHVGDLIVMSGASFTEALSTPPGAATQQLNMLKPASEKALGEWNSCEVICRGDTLECTVNGVLQNRVTGCKPAAGQIGLQLEGTPFEVRKLTIRPL